MNELRVSDGKERTLDWLLVTSHVSLSDGSVCWCMNGLWWSSGFQLCLNCYKCKCNERWSRIVLLACYLTKPWCHDRWITGRRWHRNLLLLLLDISYYLQHWILMRLLQLLHGTITTLPLSLARVNRLLHVCIMKIVHPYSISYSGITTTSRIRVLSKQPRLHDHSLHSSHFRYQISFLLILRLHNWNSPSFYL